MISESFFWKEPLLQSARYLTRVRLREGISERTLVRIEKEVLMGFYSIRKLIEAFAVRDKTKAMTFDLICFPALRAVDFINLHRIDKNYDLERGGSEHRNLGFLCNQFIHSYLFMPSDVEGRLGGIFVASDRERHKKCYFVTREQVVLAFRTVGKDYPHEQRMKRDPVSGQFDVESI